MSSHAWEFFRAAGFDQVRIDTAEDLRALATLDQKLWVALSCPVVGTTLDEATLKLIDDDGDGRIRAPQLINSIAWMDEVLTDLGELTRRADGLPLASIRTDTETGSRVLASARRILKTADKEVEGGVIQVADTYDASARLAAQPFNGDGILPPASVEDDALRSVVDDILAVTGGTADRSGVPGITSDNVAAFWAALEGFAAWWSAGEGAGEALTALGDETAAAVQAFSEVEAKIDDFFTRVRLVTFDPRSAEHLAGAPTQWEPIATRVLSATDDDIAAFPIATIAPGAQLPLVEGVNPAWAERIARLRDDIVTPLLGDDVTHLSYEQWRELGARFTGYKAWLSARSGAEVEPLGIERVRELLDGDARARIDALIARDEARRPEAEALDDVARAVRLYRDLHRLIDNFVSFRDFYGRKDLPGIFQVGVLYLDSRACELCVRVDDVGAHSQMAVHSFTYLAYCECVRRSTGEKMTIAAAFTDGDADYLMVGRNGIFYDREGRDWDATIVKILEQPLSIRQAFWSPYKRLIKFINEQLEKFAGERDQAANENLTKGVLDKQDALKQATQNGAAATPPADAAAAPAGAPAGAPGAFDIGKFAGIFAAVGLALGFVISTVTAVATGFLGLKLWQMPLALLGILLVVSGPSMLVAALKLRQRSLAPILDASGWAINARARLNIPFGASLTSVAALPAGARRSLVDPYREKVTPWKLYAALVAVFVIAAMLWDAGMIQSWLGIGAQEQAVAAVEDETAAPGEAAAPTEGAEQPAADDAEPTAQAPAEN